MLNSLTVKAFAFAAFGILCGAICWGIQDCRFHAQIADLKQGIAQANAQAEADKSAREAQFNSTLQKAQNDARTRENTLRADAADARGAANRLRKQLADNHQQMPSLTQSAVVQRADTYADVLSACVGEYQQLAEEADRHVNDKQMMLDAWPK